MHSIKCKCLTSIMSRKNLWLMLYTYTTGDEKPQGNALNIGERLKLDLCIKHYHRKCGKIKIILTNKPTICKIPLEQLANNDLQKNNIIYLSNNLIGKNPIRKIKKQQDHKRYYIPLCTSFYKQWSFTLRRSGTGKLVLNKRCKESYEYTFRYSILESRFISKCFAVVGGIIKIISFKKVNIFFEKFSEKSEEGVLDLCKQCQNSKRSKNYFVITKENNSELFEHKFVVEKYSIKYYWLLYRANNIIASEAPAHINILKTNNKILKRELIKKKAIFLQHGIIFMKNLGTSAFANGKEAEADYILVSSMLERDKVVDTMNYKDEQIWITGIPMYDKIEHGHIGGAEREKISIMLTWKPYEENIVDFKESSYFKSVVAIFDVLNIILPKEKISILAHPKVATKFAESELKDQVVVGNISEHLKDTKLLITDYSSVCYNVFYQGGAVIFYQPDLHEYEKSTGKLLPAVDEYIGARCFTRDDLTKVVKSAMKPDQSLDVSKLRLDEYIQVYSKINEYNDGRNIERIYMKLLENKIV